MKDESGFSLIEVIIAMALLIIISGSFIGAYAAHYSMIHRGKEITHDTFEAQEEIENFLVTLSGEEGVTENTYTLFSRTVTGKTVEQNIKGSRVFYTYVSDEELLAPFAPVITDALVKAYSESNVQTFPWVGSELRAEYDETDSLIFGKIHRWYKSVEEESQPLLNPRFPGQYQNIHESWDDEIGEVLENTHTQTSGRYITYGVTPFSDVGKIGLEARNDQHQILIMDNPNNYWSNYIEKVYLDYFGIGNLLKRASYGNIHTYTTLNQERLTLNVETEDTFKKPGSFVYAEIPSNDNYDFSVILEVSVDENSYIESNEIGYGVFIGEADTEGRDSGYMVEFDAGNDKVLLHEMVNGEYGTTAYDPQNVEFPWTDLHLVKISLLRSLNRLVIEFYDENDDPDEIDGDPQIIFDESIDINKNNQFIGFKTWSDVVHIDESVEIQVGQKRLSAHFYDISFNLNLAEPPVNFAVNNEQAFANTSIGSTITLSGYAVPEDIGNKNILVVWVQAEYSANSEASSCNFNGNTMTKIELASTLYQGSSGTIYTGGAMFWKVVTAGESGNIVATFPGNGSNVTNGTIHAVTLSGVDTTGPKTCTYGTATASPITTSLTGLTNGDIVITGGTNNNLVSLNPTGPGHETLTSLTVGNNNSAGAQGWLKVTGTEVENVGWTVNQTIQRAIVSLVAFSPAD